MKIVFFFREKDLFYTIAIATSFNPFLEQLKRCVLQRLVPKGKICLTDVISQKQE